MNNYRCSLPSDCPRSPEPVGGPWLSDATRSLATMSAEHRAGLHASEPCGDCPACESPELPRLEGQRDPFTAHVERRLPVDPWLASGQLVDLALGGFLHGAGGLQGDLVSLRHADIVTDDDSAAVVHSLDEVTR